MSITSNTSERDWLRASQIQDLLLTEQHHPIGFGTTLSIGIMGSAIGSLFGICAIKILTFEPEFEIVTTLGCGIIAIIGSRYWDASKTSTEQQTKQMLEQYRSYQIIQGKDLSFLLRNLSDQFQNNVLTKLNAAQIQNTMLYEVSETKYIILGKIFRTLQEPTTTLDERIELEDKILTELHKNLTSNMPYSDTLEECENIFGNALESILMHFFKYHINKENLAAIQDFAHENKFNKLSQFCSNYYDWCSSWIFI